MRFQVPQFIEVEDKIIGPLSFRQFLYVVGGAAVPVIVFLWAGWFWAVVIGGGPLALGLALAFLKVNNRPFVDFLQSCVMYVLHSRLYLWRKEPKKAVPSSHALDPHASVTKVEAPRISESRLKELAWTLDIKESMYTDEGQIRSPKTR